MSNRRASDIIQQMVSLYQMNMMQLRKAKYRGAIHRMLKFLRLNYRVSKNKIQTRETAPTSLVHDIHRSLKICMNYICSKFQSNDSSISYTVRHLVE